MQRVAAAKQIGRWLVTAACAAVIITAVHADVWAEEDETPTPVTVTVGGDGNPTLAVAIEEAKEDNTTPVIFSITTNQTGDETFDLSELTTVTLKSSTASTSRMLKLKDSAIGRVLSWSALNSENGNLTLIDLLISSDIPAVAGEGDDEGTPATIRLGGGLSLDNLEAVTATRLTVQSNEVESDTDASGGGLLLTNMHGSYTPAVPAEGENPAVAAVDKRINFSSSHIYTNSATSYGGVAQGGGVAVTNSEWLVFDSAAFSGNHTKAVAEVVDEGDTPEQSGTHAYGGGLFLNDVSNVSLKQAYFGYNTATATGQDAVAALGGALYVDGGDIDLMGSVFVYNKVVADSSALAGGGAIYAKNSVDNLLKINLTDARFSDNEVTWSDATDDETDTLIGGDVLLDACGIDGMELTLGTTTSVLQKWSGWLGNKAGSKNAITFSNSAGGDAKTINVNVNVGSACLLHMQDGMIGEVGAKVIFDINKDDESTADDNNDGEWWLGGTSVFANTGSSMMVHRGVFGLYDAASLDFGTGEIEIKDDATLALFTYTTAADAAIRNAKLTFDEGGKLHLIMRDADYAKLGIGDSDDRYFADTTTTITGLTEDQVGATSTSFSGSPLFKLTYDPGNDASCSNMVTLTRQSTAVMFPKAPSEIIHLLDTYRGGNGWVSSALNQDDVAPDALLFSAFNSTGVVHLSQQSFATSSLVTAMSRTAPRTPVGTNTVRGQYRKKRKDQGLWVMPIYSHDAARNLRAGGHRYGYTANQYGAVFGLDRFIEMFGSGGRLGFAGSAGGGTSTSNGDLLRTTGSTGFGSIYIYGDFAVSGWSQVNLAWNIGWLGSSTTVNQDYLGGRSEATVPGGSFFFAIAAERPFQLGKLCLTPSVELRYNLVYQQEFDTHWDGAHFTTTEAATGHAVTLPIGIDASLQYEVYGGTWMPLVGMSVIPNIGDRELKYSVNTGGSVIPPSMRSVIVDAIGGECQFGSHWMRRNFEWGVDYRYLFSEHFQTHNVSLLMKWCF